MDHRRLLLPYTDLFDIISFPETDFCVSEMNPRLYQVRQFAPKCFPPIAFLVLTGNAVPRGLVRFSWIVSLRVQIYYLHVKHLAS